MYVKTLSFLIFTHCISKHEESQRNVRFYSRHNKCSNLLFEKWKFIVYPQGYFCAQKYQTAWTPHYLEEEVAAFVVSRIKPCISL